MDLSQANEKNWDVGVIDDNDLTEQGDVTNNDPHNQCRQGQEDSIQTNHYDHGKPSPNNNK